MEPRTTNLIAGALTLGGTALLIAIFTVAVKPKDPRHGKLAHANVANLAPGRFVMLDTESLRYFVIRPLDSELYVLATPVDAGAVPLPDTYWWRPSMNCKDFGLDTNAGVVTNSSRFRCRDAGQSEEWAKRWQWDASGRHIPDADNTPIDDMYRVRFDRSGDAIAFTSLESD